MSALTFVAAVYWPLAKGQNQKPKRGKPKANVRAHCNVSQRRTYVFKGRFLVCFRKVAMNNARSGHKLNQYGGLAAGL